MSTYNTFSDDGLTALTKHMKVTRALADSHESAIGDLGEDLAALAEATVTALADKQDKKYGNFYIVGTGTTEGVWLGSHDDITEYYDGLTLLYKVAVAGVSGGTTLNINGLGAVSVVRNATTAITTTYPVNSVVLLTYDTVDGTHYWKVADYDSNTKTTTSTTNKTGTKLFLAGATTQGSGKTTYSNVNCYVGTDNCLYSGGVKTSVEGHTHADILTDAKAYTDEKIDGLNVITADVFNSLVE